MESSRRRSKSIAAMTFLTLIGFGFLLFSMVAIACGFIINYHNDFQATDGGTELEATLQAQFDYSQYWLGFPYFITAILSIFSGTVQKRRSLNITTAVFFHICIVLGLFAIVLEGTDWVMWKNMYREHQVWEDKDDYTCTSDGKKCVCSASGQLPRSISAFATCSNISTLSGLYGGIVASGIMGIFLSLAGIVVILKSFSWKPRRHYIEYDLRNYEKSRSNPAYWNGVPQKDPIYTTSHPRQPGILYASRDIN